MDFSEYKQLTDEIESLRNQLSELQRAVKTVFGEEKYNSLLSVADQIEESKNRADFRRALESGVF